MNSGIDLQETFIQSLTDLGLSAGVAKAVWMPLPMLLMLVGATVGVLVVVWLERKDFGGGATADWSRIYWSARCLGTCGGWLKAGL
jgi:hypothetical protein